MARREIEETGGEGKPRGFWERLARMLAPGPFPWLAGSVPDEPRFHAGRHMHGLEEHDIPDREVRRGRARR